MSMQRPSLGLGADVSEILPYEELRKKLFREDLETYGYEFRGTVLPRTSIFPDIYEDRVG